MTFPRARESRSISTSICATSSWRLQRRATPWIRWNRWIWRGSPSMMRGRRWPRTSRFAPSRRSGRFSEVGEPANRVVHDLRRNVDGQLVAARGGVQTDLPLLLDDPDVVVAVLGL